MSLDEYYIVFKDCERKYWWMRYLKDGFTHCFALRADGGRWLKYESGHGVTRVDSVPYYEELIKDCIIIKVQAKEPKKWVIINSCVGFVKLITGVGGGALTPYQLFKKVR